MFLVTVTKMLVTTRPMPEMAALGSGIDTINGLVIGGESEVFDFYQD